LTFKHQILAEKFERTIAYSRKKKRAHKLLLSHLLWTCGRMASCLISTKSPFHTGASIYDIHYQKYQDNQRRSQEPSATNPSVGTNGFTGFLYL
jgi:hypothetical protein